jgi:hypothetical protein
MPGRSVRSIRGEQAREAGSSDPLKATSALAAAPGLTSRWPARWRRRSFAGRNPGARQATLPNLPTRGLFPGCRTVPARRKFAPVAGSQKRTTPLRYGRQPLRCPQRVLYDRYTSLWPARGDHFGSAGQRRRGRGSRWYSRIRRGMEQFHFRLQRNRHGNRRIHLAGRGSTPAALGTHR